MFFIFTFIAKPQYSMSNLHLANSGVITGIWLSHSCCTGGSVMAPMIPEWFVWPWTPVCSLYMESVLKRRTEA